MISFLSRRRQPRTSAARRWRGALLLVIVVMPAFAADELDGFVSDVAQSHATQTSVVNGMRMRGVYIADENGCIAVATINLDLRRVENYRVCGAEVTQRMETVPTYPDDREGMFVLENARQAALLHGYQTTHWQDYRVEAKRVGPFMEPKCSMVETTVSYENDLIFNNINATCLP